MLQTGLMRCVLEVSIRCPAVTDEDAIIVGAQDCGHLRKTAAGLNGIQNHRGRDERPEPLQVTTDFPTHFIRTDHGTCANASRKCLMGGRRLAGRAMQRVRDRARPHHQAKTVAQQRRDLAVRQPEIVVRQHDRRDGLRPEMRSCDAQRIRDLERMPRLVAAPAGATPPDVHLKPTDVWPHDGQLFLNFIGDRSSSSARGTEDSQAATERRSSRQSAGAVRDAHADHADARCVGQ